MVVNSVTLPAVVLNVGVGITPLSTVVVGTESVPTLVNASEVEAEARDVSV